MPPLRRIHRIHPRTAEAGIWFDLTTAPGFVGLAEVDWPPVPDSGSEEEKRVGLELALNTALQTLCEKRKRFVDLEQESTKGGTRVDEDPITRDLVPEPYCRFEDANRIPTTTKSDIQDYVVRVVGIEVEVRSINPVEIGNITVSNAASSVVRV